MSRFEVDPAFLLAIAAPLRDAVDVARQVKDDKESLKGLVDDCGSPDLEDAANEFVDEWGYGMGLIADDAETIAQMLEQAAAGYTEVDTGIAEAMR